MYRTSFQVKFVLHLYNCEQIIKVNEIITMHYLQDVD